MADGYPFSLGVASGSPTATGVVLWTRLAPEPLVADGGMDQEGVAVRWELAEDERFARVVRRGTVELADGLRQASERWNVVGEATLVAPAGVGEGDERLYWTDAWDGYPAARDRLLGAVADAGARSSLMISGDAHTNYVADLRRGSEIVATEFCGTSITSQGRPQAQTDRIRASNPHIHLANSAQRGYVVFDVKPAQVRARLRVVPDGRDRATGVETLATFTVAAGRPGAHRV
jgi:alkaline phosphatase D